MVISPWLSERKRWGKNGKGIIDKCQERSVGIEACVEAKRNFEFDMTETLPWGRLFGFTRMFKNFPWIVWEGLKNKILRARTAENQKILSMGIRKKPLKYSITQYFLFRRCHSNMLSVIRYASPSPEYNSLGNTSITTTRDFCPGTLTQFKLIMALLYIKQLCSLHIALMLIIIYCNI